MNTRVLMHMNIICNHKLGYSGTDVYKYSL